MFISKHHYSVELAKRGNIVYFMNSPEKSNKLKPGEVVIENSGFENLLINRHENLKVMFRKSPE